MTRAVPRAVFLFIGGAHQVFHLAPVAAALARRGDVAVECLYDGDATGAALARVRGDDAGAMRLTRVSPPRWAEALAKALGDRSVRKLPLLLALLPRLRGADAVVTPERTSALLRRFGLGATTFIHFRHGAGDRAPASERRLSAFDLIVVPGAKDLRRAIEVRGVPAQRLRVGGYVKLDYLGTQPPPPSPFPAGLPIVLYNPHFDPALSSWRRAGAVIAAFAAQDRYALVVAPHLRLGADMDAAERAGWQALAVPGRIVVDLDSPALTDMSWVNLADIYLGDVSSQLYEFLARPRPCAFLDLHAADRASPRYAGWRLGAVTADPADAPAAVDRAIAGHAAVAAAQAAAVVDALGAVHGAVARSADIVAAALGLTG